MYRFVQIKNNSNTLHNALKKYLGHSSYVYKLCYDSSTSAIKHTPEKQKFVHHSQERESNQWLIVMKKIDNEPSTKTNEERLSVIESDFAMYRANRLLVEKIININNPKTKKQLILNDFNGKHTEYKAGTIVTPDKYDVNINNIHSNGIHYFKSFVPCFYFRDMPLEYTGVWLDFNEDGRKILEGNYVNGIKVGQWSEWYNNGIKEHEGEYSDGKKIGYWVSWYDNGSIMIEGGYENDTKTGIWIGWFNNNKVQWICNYSKGKLSGEHIEWFPDGKIRLKCNYFNGKKKGLFTLFSQWENKQKVIEGKYDDGLRIGKWTHWHSNGQKEVEGIYNKGVKNGKWIHWNEKGQVKLEVTYNDFGNVIWLDLYENGKKLIRNSGTLSYNPIV